MDYQVNGHSKHRLLYHIIFSTKYRQPALTGIEQDVYAAVRKVERSSDFEVLEMAVDLGDHLHLVIRAKPSLSPEQVVSRLKQVTLFDLWAAQGPHLRQFYWHKKQLLWAGGYYCATVGDVSLTTVLEYVKAQAR